MNKKTKLRYVASKSPDLIVEYVSKLIPYKIEIKGSPVYVNKKWYLWFNLPDSLEKELAYGDID